MVSLNIIEKRRSTLISFGYFALFAAAYYFLVKFAFWMLFPFIIAFAVAMALQRPIKFIARKTPLQMKPVAIVLVLLAFILLAAVIGVVGYALVSEFIDFFAFIKGKLSSGPEVIETIRNYIENMLVHLPRSISNYLRTTIDNMTASVLNLAEKTEETAQQTSSSGGLSLSMLSTPLNGILSTAKRLPVIFAALLVGLVSCVFMTSDYPALTGLVKNSISDEHEQTITRAKHIITGVLGKWAKSYALLLFITFCEVSLGLEILKLTGLYTGGYIIVIAICTALLDILPVFGTGTVMIPWAVISLFTHHIGFGIGLAVLYVIITVLRQVLEPKIVSSNVDVHPVITLMSMYLGIQVFGVLGVFILPITVVVIKTLNSEGIIHLWRDKKKEKEQEQAALGAAEAAAVDDAGAETAAK
jgi:sporulation integral membrane protein YtvI